MIWAMALQHNTYFDGTVQSIGFVTGERRSSVGVMDVGEYHFGTEAPERMTVVAGELIVQLPGAPWATYVAGSSFEVPGNSAFDLKVERPTAYLCDYL